MSCATGSDRVAGERSAGASEAVVECNRGGGRCEARRHSDSQLMRSASFLVLAPRAMDRGVERLEVGFELSPPEVLVADDDQHLARQRDIRDARSFFDALDELARAKTQDRKSVV